MLEQRPSFLRPDNCNCTYLCPLDRADSDFPEFEFGPNTIRKLQASELAEIFAPERLEFVGLSPPEDLEGLSQFVWLLVRDSFNSTKLRTRFPPNIFDIKLNQDFGAFKVHPKTFPASIEKALFAILLLPWEDWMYLTEIDWRPFDLPWVYLLPDSLLEPLQALPSSNELSWEQRTVTNSLGEYETITVPEEMQISDADKISKDLMDDITWQSIEKALASPLFETPVLHFFLRGFLEKDIDSFLAHLVAIEAALGLQEDYKEGKGSKRLKSRLRKLTDEPRASEELEEVYDIRNNYLHGRSMDKVGSNDRNLARKLARKTVEALVRYSNKMPEEFSRQDCLAKLLS